MEEQLRRDALEYHRVPTFGKISVTPTKSLVNQRDLALAYSPGVAYACLAIKSDPNEAATLTSRANLVAVISNGTAVLGLGDIGALAGKPVMEGKACLFKKFAGIDVFDIEIGEKDPDKFVEIVASLEPTFGGINLEDIKAPECFFIERALRQRMKIPVFHDDQHGTAIIAAAAVLNGLRVVGKDLRKIKLTCCLSRSTRQPRTKSCEYPRRRCQGCCVPGPSRGYGYDQSALCPRHQRSKAWGNCRRG
jgi:malate dehydrogenase (oxaloacetate-decarboxylating)(NADP+)